MIPSFSTYEGTICLDHDVVHLAPFNYQTLLAEGVKLDLIHSWEFEGF
jgi:hypothetical protein